MASLFEIRRAGDSDLEACIELWVRACAVRDGVEVAGVAERARAKFAQRVLWLVAGPADRPSAFGLITVPGSAADGDPRDAAVLGLLAVAPHAQGAGLGRAMLRSLMSAAREVGYPRLVLHALVDNSAAVRLYESEGWRLHGVPVEHSLLRRPSRSFVVDL